MSRINIADDEDYPGQFGLWQANCDRSIRGKAGQAALKRLEAALLALPEKRLIQHDLDNSDGVCAFGALAQHEGTLSDARRLARNEYMEDVGESLGFPKLVAWKVVWENDEANDWEYVKAEGPTKPFYVNYPDSYRNEGVLMRVQVTPEQRYENVLKWVQESILR